MSKKRPAAGASEPVAQVTNQYYSYVHDAKDLENQGFEQVGNFRKEAPWHDATVAFDKGPYTNGESVPANLLSESDHYFDKSRATGVVPENAKIGDRKPHRNGVPVVHSKDWKRGDYVVVELPLNANSTYKQHLVAAADPTLFKDIDSDGPWVVVADENDWNAVGTVKTNAYIREMNAQLIFRLGAEEKQQLDELVPPRASLLREAEGLITGDRNKSYGSPTENFTNIADLWNVQFAHKLKDGERFTATDVAVAMIHVKQARLIAHPKRDNFVDIAGYAACGWETQDEVGSS